MTANILSHCDDWSLSQWLCYLETIHTKEIDLGLARIAEVAKRLNIDLSFGKVITVAGTNGKGTTCAFIENYLRSQQYNVAVYSSPHIERFNERLRVNHEEVDDSPWIRALKQVELARSEISLTYYEYTTLAAFIVIGELKPDYIILEVGLGGRLDATNIIDADVAVLTTVDLDHMAFLGNTREAIGKEKAGIFRTNRPAIIGELAPPVTVLNHANDISAIVCCRDKDFTLVNDGSAWQWQNKQQTFSGLIATHIPQNNVATAIATLAQLEVPLSSEAINHCISVTKVPGRTEMFSAGCDVMLDVGHNPQAARYLSTVIKSRSYNKIHAVVGMLADKDSTSTLNEIKDVIDSWYFATPDSPRAATSEVLSSVAQDIGIKGNCFDNVTEAFTMAKQVASSNDLILVFGSFFTVAEIRALLLSN